MKILRNLPAKWLTIWLLLGTLAVNAALPAPWQYQQTFDVAAPGLMKISLPLDTLDSARPALEDLRLCDDAGNELPFLIERPAPVAKAIQPAKSFHVSLEPSATVITLETGLVQPLDAVTLESPAQNFIKAVRVDVSNDGQTWRNVVQGQPIFRQPYGAGNLKVGFPPTSAHWLRLTVDDRRSQPVPFISARVFAATAEAAVSETQSAVITERIENPGETRLTLNLGAANLDVASVQIETSAPLFTRQVTLAVPQVTEAGVVEQMIGQGTIYCVAVDDQPSRANLVIPLDQRVSSRELILLIHNEDSPPLPISGVRCERRPVYLAFMAPNAGPYHLLTGNKLCASPHYDLATLAGKLKIAEVTALKISPVSDNPDYHAPEALAGLDLAGAPLDVAGWKYRKPIQTQRAGVQQVELDLEVLSHANGSFSDLRVMHGSNQVPFLVQRTSIRRSLEPVVTLTNDVKNPKISRWLIKLPRAHLPITRLTCISTTPLFQRNVTLSEQYTDERGYTFFRQLGNATWIETMDHKSREFSLVLNSVVDSDTLVLETQNGDNPAIGLEKFAAYYPATRLLFKSPADDGLLLYYGNPQSASPSYDLNLVAGELLSADKATATLGAEVLLKKSSWAERQSPGSGGALFWGILAVVVIGLLAVISRLLPKSPPN